MCIYVAHLYNIPQEKEENKVIEFDDQFFDTEEECWNYAIKQVFKMKTRDEAFVSLEMVGC